MHGYWIFAIAVFFGSLELIALYVEQCARAEQERTKHLATKTAFLSDRTSTTAY